MLRLRFHRTGRLDGLGQRFQRAVDETLEEVAHAIPKILARNYAAGLAPDGSPQQPNQESTREQKIRALGHAISGLGREGILSDPDRYTVLRRPDGSYHVLPPEDRFDAIRGLKDRNYRVHEMPEEAKDILVDGLTRRLAAL